MPLLFSSSDRVAATNKSNQNKILYLKRAFHVATSDKQYTDDELEFINAMYDYSKSTNRKFPTYSEILNVLKTLGYQKQNQSN